MLVDQHVPHVPFLRHSDQGWIDDGFTVWVVVTRSVAGNLSALDPRGTRGQVQVVHGDENTSLTRLETVANVGQGSTDDDAHGVRQVTITQFVFDRFLDYPLAFIAPIAA